MKQRYTPGLVIGFLFLLSTGASGIAIMNGSFLRTRSYFVTIDCDSLRADPFTGVLESFHNTPLFLISPSVLSDILSVFPQTERVAVTRKFPDTILIDLTAKKPVLTVWHTSGVVCLTEDGTPFPWVPEHGELPRVTITADMDWNPLLDPGDTVREFFALALAMQPFPTIRTFSHFSCGDDYSFTFYDPATQNRIKLPRKFHRNRSVSLADLDILMKRHVPDSEPLEYDLRFPGIVVVRPLEKGARHG